MRGRLFIPFAGIAVMLFSIAVPSSTFSQTPEAFSIDGAIDIPDDGCNQAVVVLCDLISGEPLYRGTMEPFTAAMVRSNNSATLDWVFSLVDSRGHFQFTNVPAGDYVVVAQAWKADSQPTNLLEFRAETIHLLGRTEVRLPSEQDAKLHLVSPGKNNIQFDQQFPNNDGLLMLSTRPQFGDPILAWFGWGTNFLSHIIGFNWMPRGKTMIHGLPDEVYASIFMNDNSPGFGSMKLSIGKTNTVRMPIVAGWSDGYKVPPTNLVWLVDVIQTNKISLDKLLGVPPVRLTENFIEVQRDRWHFLRPLWDNEVVLPTGQKVRVGDLVVANGYAQLNRKREN